MTEEKTWYKKLDWLDIAAQLTADIAGPLGAPLKALARIRSDLKEDVNTQIAKVTDDSGEINGVLNNISNLAAVKTEEERLLLEYFFTLVNSSSSFEGVNNEKVLIEQLKYRITVMENVLSEEFRLVREALAKYIFDKEEIKILLVNSKIPLEKIKLEDTSEIIWFSVENYLKGNDPMYRFRLLFEAYKMKPNVEIFRQAIGL